MKNLGKANVRVKLYESLPWIDPNPQNNDFDVSAHMWQVIQNSEFFYPFLTECVTDDLGAFAACFPSRRTLFIDNYIKYRDGSSLADVNSEDPSIVWTPISDLIGVIKDIVEQGEYNTYTLEQPMEQPENYSNNYEGPKWKDSSVTQEPPPDDATAIKKWIDWYKGEYSKTESEENTSTTPTATTPLAPDVELPKINYVNQQKVGDGLWWGIESSDFLYKNMPFWVTIRRQEPPSSSTHPTVLIVSLGLNENSSQCFDLMISNNQKPNLIDYYKGRGASSEETGGTSTAGIPAVSKEFPLDLSKIFSTEKEIRLGFMTSGGRLIIFVDKAGAMVYTRVEKSESNAGRIAEAAIDPGKIRIYGTNIQASINVSPMVFAPLSVMALPVQIIPITVDPTNGESIAPEYHELKYNGTVGSGSVARLPTPPQEQQLFGVDCKRFFSGSGNESPYGFTFHKNGTIIFEKGKSLGFNVPNSDYYVLVMKPSDTQFSTGVNTHVITNGGCPYFFRLKGADRKVAGSGSEGYDVSEDVFSVSETKEAPDYFSVKSNANITLYNKGGKYDYLKFSQKGVSIEWGWNSYTQTFTGIVIGATTGEVAGKETIELICRDYMYILERTPIINSPFYDGMVMVYAVRDVAQRAGISQVINDWEMCMEYFLPSGYAFTKPVVKFGSKQMLFECIQSMIKPDWATIYFDAYGKMHIKKLPGGPFSVGAGEATVAKFYRNPAAEHVILGEKNLEYTTEPTVNRIRILTLDRDTRNPIVIGVKAGLDDSLKFRKPMLIDSPIYGDYDVARAYLEQLKQQVFKPMRKISFKTVGDSETIMPLSFITVDDLEFRLLSLTRRYNSENNDFTNEYNAEWFGTG